MECSLAAGVLVCTSDQSKATVRAGAFHMPATGELIRLMNYVDDINATLRKITSTIGTMTDEERKRLSEYMSSATSGLKEVISQLEKSVR
jgi:hypothetical protein